MLVTPWWSQIGLVAVMVLLVTLWIWALIDIVCRQFDQPNAKLIWLLVVLFGQAPGAIIYWVFGKKRSLPISSRTAA